jgi:hypothetical protein
MKSKLVLGLSAALVVGSVAVAGYGQAAGEGATAEQASVSADNGSAGFEQDACPLARRAPRAGLPHAGFRYGLGWRGLPARVRGWWRY